MGAFSSAVETQHPFPSFVNKSFEELELRKKRLVKMPREIKEIKDFLMKARRKDAESVNSTHIQRIVFTKVNSHMHSILSLSSLLTQCEFSKFIVNSWVLPEFSYLSSFCAKNVPM